MSMFGAQRRRRWSLLGFLVCALCLLSALGATPASCARDATTMTATLSSTVCPSSPMCSRNGAPGSLRRRYCHSLSSLFRYLFSAGASSSLSSSSSSSASSASTSQGNELPYYEDAVLRRHVLQEAEQLLVNNIVGQDHVIGPLLKALRTKLRFPSEPLVLHLAGDNGVGKTFTARLLSLALSLRCAPGRTLCDAGDGLLSISGTSFDGLSVADVREVIVGRVLQHMVRHPHGVVLIDDFTAMDPALVPVLAPLLGRAAHYPEQFIDTVGKAGGDSGSVSKPQSSSSSSSLSSSSTTPLLSTTSPPSLGQLLVIITTDLGQQGRTTGKSAAQIEQLVRDSFSALYGSLLPAYTRTFAYLPFTTHVAVAVVRQAVANLPCTMGAQAAVVAAAEGSASAGSRAGAAARRSLWWLIGASSSVVSGVGGGEGGGSHAVGVDIVASSIDEHAVLFLVERHRYAWEGKENGHALHRVVEDELVAQILAFQERQGLATRIVARFVLNDAKMAVVLDTRNGDGKFVDEDDETGSGSGVSHDL